MSLQKAKAKVIENKRSLGAYLAGLWEGDGNIRFVKGAKPSISISFHSYDAPLEEKLLTVIGSKCNSNVKVGSVYYHKTRCACYLTLYSVEALVCFITLVNGKLRSPKAYQIDLIIDWLNQKHNAKLKK